MVIVFVLAETEDEETYVISLLSELIVRGWLLRNTNNRRNCLMYRHRVRSWGGVIVIS